MSKRRLDGLNVVAALAVIGFFAIVLFSILGATPQQGPPLACIYGISWDPAEANGRTLSILYGHATPNYRCDPNLASATPYFIPADAAFTVWPLLDNDGRPIVKIKDEEEDSQK